MHEILFYARTWDFLVFEVLLQFLHLFQHTTPARTHTTRVFQSRTRTQKVTPTTCHSPSKYWGHHWTGKLRSFCRPPVLTLVSLSLLNTFLVTLYVITTRIILQKHPRKSIHIWYIRLIVIFILPLPMNAELPSTSLDLACSCVKCQVLTGHAAWLEAQLGHTIRARTPLSAPHLSLHLVDSHL